jgi:hypothetical protein
MSQAGIVDIEGSHPQIPTAFVTNMGTAIPIANTLEILGTTVAAHSIPLQTVGSGNTVTIQAQYASASATSVANNAGFASFNSADFTVDANGYVSFSGSVGAEAFEVDASTAPGTNPVEPNGSGIVTVTGGQVAAGTTVNVIRTNSLAANTYTIQIQRSQAVASSTVGDNGVSHFNSAYFTVDGNGFVSLNGSAIGETITGNTGGALSPTAGNWNILGTSTVAGTIPVQTAGSGSTLTVQVQKSQAIASTNATNVGLAAFNSSFFTVDANGFVSINGSGIGETITGNTGGALSPTSGNWNILGTSTAAGTTPVQTAGSGSTLTVQVQKAQAIASTNATNVGVAAFSSSQFSVDANGFVTLNGSAVAETITGQSGGALSPTAGNWNIFGGTVVAGSTPVSTSGSGSTLTTNVQISQAIASTDATKIGLAAFNSADFSVDANGFVTAIATTMNYTNVTHAMSPYTVLAADKYISVDASGGVVTLNFPNAPTALRTWIIKDRTGSSATSNITLTTPGGTVTFDGLTSYIMNSNYQAINLLANSTPTYEVY